MHFMERTPDGAALFTFSRFFLSEVTYSKYIRQKNQQYIAVGTVLQAANKRIPALGIVGLTHCWYTTNLARARC